MRTTPSFSGAGQTTHPRPSSAHTPAVWCMIVQSISNCIPCVTSAVPGLKAVWKKTPLLPSPTRLYALRVPVHLANAGVRVMRETGKRYGCEASEQPLAPGHRQAVAHSLEHRGRKRTARYGAGEDVLIFARLRFSDRTDSSLLA